MVRSGLRRRLANAFVAEAFHLVLDPVAECPMTASERDDYLGEALAQLRREIATAPAQPPKQGQRSLIAA